MARTFKGLLTVKGIAKLNKAGRYADGNNL
jgi:hypothetical protein